MAEPPTAQPRRREARDAAGNLLAEWWVISDLEGVEVHHGEFTAYHPNGQRREHGYYHHGSRVGPWYGWTDDGRRLYDKIHDPSAKELPVAEEPRPEDWDQPVAPQQPQPGERERAGLWVELLVVLALAWLPFMVTAALTPDLFVSNATLLNLPASEDLSNAEGVQPPELAASPERMANRNDWAFIFAALPQVASSIQVLAVMLFLLVLRRQQIPLSEAGLVRPRWLRDLGLGLALFAIAEAVYYLASLALPSNSFVDYSFYPTAAAGYTLMTVSLLLNSVMEELVWRGYLMQRLTRLGASTAIAVVVSSAMFASYHLYHGPVGVVKIFMVGVIYALAFRLCKSLWPSVFAHTLYNALVYTGAFEAVGM